MRVSYLLVCVASFVLCSSFAPSMECEYAGSNVNFAKSQTTTALSKDNINTARYHAYKALNAIVKSKKQLAACGCQDADLELEEALQTLKIATKAASLSATKVLLERALEYTGNGLLALEEHHLHDSKYNTDALALNTINSDNVSAALQNSNIASLNQKIDISLKKYEASLAEIVTSVPCKEARDYAENIFENCEKELLKQNLSEGKKYYNLRTKEITKKALAMLTKCNK